MLSPDRNAEDTFSVLRYSVILGVHNLPIVRVSQRRQKIKPTVKVGFEFLAHKIFYVFQKQVFRKIAVFRCGYQ